MLSGERRKEVEVVEFEDEAEDEVEEELSLPNAVDSCRVEG